MDARRAAEHAARTSYGRLLSLLAARSRDIAASEDALSEAFASALTHWPGAGVPANPEAWLLTAARNHMKNTVRHQGIVEAAAADLALLFDEAVPLPPELPDDRLKLMFVCAHPAIDEGVRTPLMLQTVLGLDARPIGAVFLVSPATMGQRLVRAKSKIRDSGLRFEVPSAEDMPQRLDDVLNAIYAAFGTSWDATEGARTGMQGLASEAIYLGRLLVELLPTEPEPKGLLALMLHCQARHAARRGPQGEFIPLKEQDTTRWAREMIVEAENLLVQASAAGRFGRYQCEASIQSVHAQRAWTGTIHHPALLTLYGLLAEHHPSVGALVGQAAALIDAGRPTDALAVLGRLDVSEVDVYQPYWVTMASAQAALDMRESAAQSWRRAIGLTEDPSVRAFLQRRLQMAGPGPC